MQQAALVGKTKIYSLKAGITLFYDNLRQFDCQLLSIQGSLLFLPIRMQHAALVGKTKMLSV